MHENNTRCVARELLCDARVLSRWRSCGIALATTVASACAGDGGDAPLVVTPGQAEDDLGKADTSRGPRAELKLTIDRDQIEQARAQLGLDDGDGEARDIWFYDTAWLDLYEQGAILRARKIDGDDDDSTVKLRPFEASDIDPSWLELEGFKCEVDRSIDHETSSCSYTVAQDAGEIDAVGDGDRDIDKLFSSEQEDFLWSYGPYPWWSELDALGPIEARVWTIDTDALPDKVTAELWFMPDGSEVLELSMKVPVDDGDDGMDALVDFTDERGLDLDADQESKTRRALESLSGHALAREPDFAR